MNSPVASKKTQCRVVVRLYGSEHSFEMSQDETTLLEAAENNGLIIDSQCRTGICGTCRCKLVSGEVDMMENWVLDESEVEEGFILACRSRARSDEIILEYE